MMVDISTGNHLEHGKAEVRVWAIINAMKAGLNRINPGGKINGTSIKRLEGIS